MNFEQTTNILSLEITELLRKKMRFIATMQQIFGVLMAISGGLTCIGIITAIFGVPILLAGIKLFQSGSALNLAADFKKGDDLAKALEGLHGYWKFTLIGIILLIVFYIILFAVIIAMIPSYSSYY